MHRRFVWPIKFPSKINCCWTSLSLFVNNEDGVSVCQYFDTYVDTFQIPGDRNIHDITSTVHSPIEYTTDVC